MHRSLILFPILFFLLSSCATKTKKSKPYKTALTNSFKELEESRRGREIASKDTSVFLKEVLPYFRVLNKNFDVLVFPKKGIHQMNSKFALRDNWDQFEKEFIRKWGTTQGKEKFQEFLGSTVNYRSPIRYRFSDLTLGSCYKIVLENNPNWGPRSFFGGPKKFNLNRSKKCLVLKVREVGKRKKSKNKSGVVKETILYLDDNLKSYGTRQLIKGRKRDYWVSYKSEENSPLSSESTYFPIDIPNFFDFMTRKNWKKQSSNVLNIPEDRFVKDSIKKLMRNKSCKKGFTTQFLDTFRNQVRIGWCKKHYWPTTIHTNHYFSILIQGAQGR